MYSTGIDYRGNLAVLLRTNDIPANCTGDCEAVVATGHQCTHTQVLSMFYGTNHPQLKLPVCHTRGVNHTHVGF